MGALFGVMETVQSQIVAMAARSVNTPESTELFAWKGGFYGTWFTSQENYYETNNHKEDRSPGLLYGVSRERSLEGGKWKLGGQLRSYHRDQSNRRQ